MIKTQPIAIQDTYGDRFQHCWGCGPENTRGLHLQTFPSLNGDSCVTRVTPDDQYTGGVPANLFGGLIAMVFDCHGTASAAWFAHQAKGLELTESTIIGRFITAHLEVDYKSPSPMGEEMIVTSHLLEMSGRKALVAMELIVAGQVRAEAKMVAVAVKDTM